jgi:hypothetical protein
MAFRLSSSDRVFLAISATFVVFLLLAPVVLPREVFVHTFSEAGFFENLSFYGWLVAPILIFLRVRPIGYRAVAFALLSLAFAAREADWQKKFTTEGAMKINYYQNASVPIMERLIAGIIVLILIAGLIYAVYASIRFLFFEGGWKERSGVWLFITGICLVLGKSFDRLPAELDNLFNISISSGLVTHLTALEEGLEALAPVVFLWSVWLSGYGKSYLARVKSDQSVQA